MGGKSNGRQAAARNKKKSGARREGRVAEQASKSEQERRQASRACSLQAHRHRAAPRDTGLLPIRDCSYCSAGAGGAAR